MRMKIAIGAANGLAFLQEEASRPIIFPDFKTSKILLDMVITSILQSQTMLILYTS